MTMCVGRIGINEFGYGADQSLHAYEIDRLRTENEFLRHQVRNMRKECDTAIDRASKKENEENMNGFGFHRNDPNDLRIEKNQRQMKLDHGLTYSNNIKETMSNFSLETIEIASKISTGEFSHIESPLVFQIVEAVMRELGKSNNDEINVNKNKIDNQMDIRLLQSDKMLSYDEQAGARLKVLDLAIASFEGVLERPGNDKLIDTAQRFYNYITKGE